MSDAEHADALARDAGLAFKAGNYDEAVRLLWHACYLDPERAGLWDARERRVLLAESKATPLDELLARRLERASIGPDDPAIQMWVQHNEAVIRDQHELEM